MAAAAAEPDSSKDPDPRGASSSAGAAAGVGGPNPCCAKLWRKYQKVENSRNLLREAVRLLEIETKKLREENSGLSKACKEERLRGDSAETARGIESDARELLEKEIIELKSQNSTLQKTQNICKNDNELCRISELEEENRRLKQVLGEERKKTASEKKTVDEEKSKALEMQKILRSETQKSEEYRRVADTERKVASDWRASCERLKSEVNEVRARLTAQIQKTEEALKSVEAEKLKLSREKKHADSEKSFAEKKKALIEVEKKKVMEEKKRAENLSAKLEEQKKLNEDLRTSIQAERKNTVEEKKRADNLFQKLEEERKRNECLQRKANELSAVRDVVSSAKYGRQLVDRASESANVKLLKEKLKLKKEQLKHAKNVSKLDKAKNAMVRREFQLIKQDWMQLLSRFNMLDDHLAGGIEGIHALTELKQHQDMHGFQQRLLPNDPVEAPYLGLQAGIPFSSSIPREYTSYQLPRESCTRPVSGTSSELGPPLGSSLRTKSKSHNRSSFPTSISDKKFMGSQGKDSLLLSSSADIRGKQNLIPLIETNDTTRQDDRTVVQEALKSPLSCGTEVTGRTLAGARKRKRPKQSLESSACLSSKHDFMHLKSKAHAATSNDVLACTDDLSVLQHGNNVVTCVTEGDMENHRRKYLAIADKAASFGCPAKVPSPGGGNTCAGSRISSLLSFEEKIGGNFLKLLSLDNDADEEKYRRAKEKPLSPNLPIIRPRRNKARTHEEPHNFGCETINVCPASGSNVIDFKSCTKILEVKGPVVQKSTQNDIQLDPSSNRMDCRNSFKLISANNKSDATVNVPCNAEFVGIPTDTSLGRLLLEDNVQNTIASSAVGSATTSAPVFAQSGCSNNPNSILHSCKEVPDKNSSQQICERSSDPGLQTIFGTSEAEGIKLGSDSNSILGHHCESQKTPVHLIGFTRMKSSSIENIFRYWEKLTSEAGKVSKEASIDGPLLERVSTEQLLHIDEKVSLIFSLLLWGIGFTAEPLANGNYSSSAFSLSVKSYMETRWAFLPRDQLDVLVSLIEDFLTNREVVVCEKIGQKVSDANKHHNLDGEADILSYTKPATINQLISACILLGSICVEVDRVDIILEVSYKIVHMGKSNISWTLLALHVFNLVCGDKYLFPKSGSFLVTAIQLVVLLLESKDASPCLMSSYIQRNIPTLPSCEHCPFNVDTVCVDGFLSSLLDELDLCSLLWNNRANSNETIARCSTHLGSSGLEINCFEPCSIFKQGKLAEDSHNLCYFMELISLLELFGIYMSCDWTYNNVVVRLLKILESCTCEEYAAALLVLVGQLGRFFIDDVGYEQRAVSELRNKLSLLMGTSFTKSRSVTVQFSAIGALLVLLPLPFDKVVATQSRSLSGPFVLQASQISDWFFSVKQGAPIFSSFLF